MKILVVNDDGITSPGIALLAETLKPFGTVSVVAPHTEQSAIGHGITIHDPIRLHHRKDLLPDFDSWSLEAKPADCVKFARFALNLEVDLVVSGINNGPNLGTDITYSGTMAGASEGVILGIPAIAVSSDFGTLEVARKELPGLIRKILDENLLSPSNVININFPKADFSESKGVRVASLGKRPFLHDFVEEDGVYWARGGWDSFENDPETDVWAYENGWTSITPVQIDRTNFVYMKKLFEKL